MLWRQSFGVHLVLKTPENKVHNSETVKESGNSERCETLYFMICQIVEKQSGDVAQLVRALPSNSHQENKALTPLVSMLVSALIG
jgi:hypothetical protein